MNSLGPAVRRLIQKTRENRKNNGSFLKGSRKFDDLLRYDNEIVVRLVLNILRAEKTFNSINEWVTACSCLLANLTWDRLTRSVAIRRSKNAKNYKKNYQYSDINGKIVKIMDLMEKHRLIDSAPAIHHKNPKKQHLNKVSRIWRTPKLLDYIECLPSHIIRADPKELVELKGPENKKTGKRPLIEYGDTDDTIKLRNKLKAINKVNKMADIRLFVRNEWIHLHTDVKAVFIENFDQWGRLYSHNWAHFQQYSGDDRERTKINGDNVVEVDWSGLHPHMLYAQENIQFEDYAEESGQFEKPDDPYSIKGLHEDLRSFLKNMLLTMINSETQTEANQASNNWLNFKKSKDFVKTKRGETRTPKFWINYNNLAKIWENPSIDMDQFRLYNKIIENYDHLPQKDKKKHQKYCRNVVKAQRQLYLRMTEPEKKAFKAHLKNKKLYFMSSKGLLEKFLNIHAPIKEHLCNGRAGYSLTNKDSQMAVDICYHFADKGVPILPVHDSFIIQEKHAHDLEKKMTEVYKQYNNGFTCPIH